VKKEELLQTKDGLKKANSGSDSLDKYTERMCLLQYLKI